jgi:hypothetical protein
MSHALPPAAESTTAVPAAGARSLDPHRLEMAAMLAEISIEIEQLGEVLCHDPEFVRRHVRELQAIDLIAQKQRALAAVLGAECPTSALAGVGLEEVVTRFKSLTTRFV